MIGHTDEVWSVSFSLDGQKIVSGGKDDSVRIWSTSSKKLDRESILLPVGHWPGGSSPSNDKEMTWDSNRVNIWNKDYTKVIHYVDSVNDRITGAAWISENEVIVYEEEIGALKIWNIENHSVMAIPFEGEFDIMNYHRRKNQIWGLSRDNNLGTWSLKKWQARTGKLEFSFSLSDVTGISDWSISRDGNWIAIAKGKNVEIRNISLDSSESFVLETTHNSIQGLALLPEKSVVFTASTSEPTIHVWNYKTQELLATMEGHNLVISYLDLSRDGQRLASKSIGDEPILIWDTRSWNQVAELKGRSGYFQGLPDFLHDENNWCI